ncbi:hypothetical protein HWI79_1616 [Cryptosporidium felis]|nr:hypothetical protein HWI79_1616 [Cryptosporidium felis]
MLGGGRSSFVKEPSGMIDQPFFGSQNIHGENSFAPIKTAEISPLRSGLIINQESENIATSGPNVIYGHYSGLSTRFPDNIYPDQPARPPMFFQSKNIPIINEMIPVGVQPFARGQQFPGTQQFAGVQQFPGDQQFIGVQQFARGQQVHMGSEKMPSFLVGVSSRKAENSDFTVKGPGVQMNRLNIPSNSVKSASATPSNGLNEAYGQNEGLRLGSGDVSRTSLRQAFQSQNIARSNTGSNLSVTQGNQTNNCQENSNLNVNSSIQNGNYYSEKGLSSSIIREEPLQYEQFPSINAKSHISQPNTSLNQPFLTNPGLNQSQINSVANHQLLNSVPLLAQIQIESIQDLPGNCGGHSAGGGVYNSIATMDYSIVASFNNVDDKNETYKIGPFPSGSMGGSRQISCIIHDEVSIPFSWTQPVLKLKVLEENDFRVDILGSCSINIDINSLGIPSQACLVDPQTNQVVGTLRFTVKLVPNQQNPNYRFDQIHGPNSILNRRVSQENSFFNIFKGFCCTD